MGTTRSNLFASDWLALREVWAQVPTVDRPSALSFFQLSEVDLMAFSRSQLVAAFETL